MKIFLINSSSVIIYLFSGSCTTRTYDLVLVRNLRLTNCAKEPPESTLHFLQVICQPFLFTSMARCFLLCMNFSHLDDFLGKFIRRTGFIRLCLEELFTSTCFRDLLTNLLVIEIRRIAMCNTTELLTSFINCKNRYSCTRFSPE